MGISFKYSKRIAKIGTQLLIPLIVIDTAWSLIRFVLYNTLYDGEIPRDFDLIDNIVTNILFTAFACVLAIGMMMLSIYYIKISRTGIVASVSLFSHVGIKVAFIFFRFIQLILGYTDEYMRNTFYTFELVTSLLLIGVFIVLDIFQRQLMNRANIGKGGSVFPYIFGFFALIYPISNVLSLLNIDFVSNPIAFPIMRTIAYVASMIQILVYFDLLRRFDFMQSIDSKKTDETPVKIESNQESEK